MDFIELLDFGDFEKLRESIVWEMSQEESLPPKKLLDLIEAEVRIGKRKSPKDYPTDYAILVNHFRGRSTHKDFRRKRNGWLEGETIVDETKDSVTEDVKTVADGKRWQEKLIKQKKFKFRPDMDPGKHVVIIPKAKQPLEWLNIREISLAPGKVGATAEKWGVFVTEDEGIVHYGVQKPLFKEFFLDMKKYKGRMAERLLEVKKEWKGKPKKALQWQGWFNLKDQTPYIISKRGRTKKDYVPKEGEKAIPPEWEKKIPEELQWWKKGLKAKERMKRLDLAFNHLVEKDEIKARPIEIKESEIDEIIRLFEARMNWIVRHRYWKGPVVVRGMPVSSIELLVDSGKKYIDAFKEMSQNPLEETDKPIISKYQQLNAKTPDGKPFREWMRWEGTVAPKDARFRKVEVLKEISQDGSFKYLVRTEDGKEIETKENIFKFPVGSVSYLDQRENLYRGEGRGAVFGNPNERIPVFVKVLASGTGEIIEDASDFKSFKFKGKIKDYHTAKRESPTSDIFTFQKSALPGQLKDSLLEGIEIQNIQEFKFPVFIRFNEKIYQLNRTSKGGLILNKSEYHTN